MPTNKEPKSTPPEISPEREITTELKESFLAYSMSVIVDRALPDVRDGLKPVQRRILWAMWQSGLNHSSRLRKSANVVGETMAKYHPHGDSAIYDTMARMAQDFSLRYPLIHGQGNWGSIDGDSPAAMRYCVTGDTLVITDRGLMPIKDLSKDLTTEQAINIKVLSRDRQINKSSKWFNSGIHPTKTITTAHGYSLRASLNHPLLVWSRSDATPSFHWKFFSDLKIGDVAVVDRTSDLLWPTLPLNLTAFYPSIPLGARRVKHPLPEKLDADLAHILGALISEGSISHKKIEFCNSDLNWVEEFKTRWTKVFPTVRLHEFKKSPSSYGRKPYIRLEIHSVYVVDFLRRLGLLPVTAKNKTIPPTILHSTKSIVASFLSAYFEGDGSVSSSGRMNELSCCSVSPKLIKELQTLLLRFGLISARRFDSYRRTHKLYLRGLSSYRLFKDQIDFISTRKKNKLNTLISNLSKDAPLTDYIPHLRDFVLDHQFGPYQDRRFLNKHNFDRYPNLSTHASKVISLVEPKLQLVTSQLVEHLLSSNYLFDPIVSIKNSTPTTVYSIRVDSDCHSFISNGLISHNTECKMAKIAEELLTDIEKDTVDWKPNYDATRNEPKVLPAKLPNLLINGSMGIAVGMATSIPPHNLGEVVDATNFLIDNPEADTKNLLNFIQGPDFPTGAIIYDKQAIAASYLSGRGGITARAVTDIVPRGGKEKSNSFDIIISEIPYQVNKSDLIKKMAELVIDKKIEGIRDIRDESDKDGLRVVIELKNDAAPQKILNQLFKHTDLQKNFNLNMVALADGREPQVMSLRDIIAAFIAHRQSAVRRRTAFELNKAKERAHILEGLKKALDVIDKVIATIKKSKNKADAHLNLIKQFKFSDAQATAILEMRLQSLAALERQKIEEELKAKQKLIAELESLLKSPKKIDGVIKDELTSLKDSFAGVRRTKVIPGAIGEFREEDLIPEEEAIITLSAGGYIKRLPPNTFKSQKRGGKGLIGGELNEEDMVSEFIGAGTHDNILFFTDKGKVFQTKVYEIPVASRTSKGKAIHNFLDVPLSDKISAIVTYQTGIKEDKDASLVMATKHGVIKKTHISDFTNVRRSGIIAINLKGDDQLEWVGLSLGKDEIILTTKAGQSVRFKESDVRPMGRASAGVIAIKLSKGDEVSSMNVISKEAKDGRLLVVMEQGYGKQTPLKEYKTQKRGGSGIRTANVTNKTGRVVSAKIITDQSELFALSSKGQIIKTDIDSIRIAGRSTQGVKIMTVKPGDKIAGLVCL